MNRILQADVILTLTREQAERLMLALHEEDFSRGDLCEMVREQCDKQGVQL